MTTTTLGIAGAGTMGSGIALAALRAGLQVTLYDIAEEMLPRAERYIQKHLTRKGQEAALEHLTLSSDLNDLGGADLVIEAAVEDLSLKKELFGQLDSICPPPAILATNTSTLPITAIAAAVESPARVGGMHFFNPAAVLPLVEVGRGAQTSEGTVHTLVNLAEQMGKTPVVTGDIPGFIVNRCARPFYGEALRLLGESIATHEEIDQVVEAAGGFRMGPFRLMDLIGIDVNFAATQSMYDQTYHEPRYRPHWIQAQMVQQNALGRKTGRGFYSYDPPSATSPPAPGRTSEAQPRMGAVRISAGSWAPGLPELCARAGYRQNGAEIIAGFVVAGRAEAMKEHVRAYDQALPPDVPLFCQAVDVTVGEIATWITHPERLIGFDGLFLGNGEVATLVASPVLAGAVRKSAERFLAAWGRLAIWIADGPALILPRIVCMLANEAAFALGEGVAEADTINRAMTLGVSYPKGPLSWAREIGYGRVAAVIEHLHAEYGEPRYRTAPVLRRLAREEIMRAGR